MINVDTYIEKGRDIGKNKSHMLCQDYAISSIDPFPYVIISDGCSSSKDSDVGARILALAAKNFLTQPKDYFINYFKSETLDGSNCCNLYKTMGLCIVNNAFSIANLMSLRLECLNASLIISFEIENVIYTFIYGDGNIIFIGDEVLKYTNISFPSSAPFYLSYYLNPKREREYFEEFEDKKIVTDIYPDKSNNDIKFFHGCKDPAAYSYNIEDNYTLIIGSDGMNSFISNDDSIRPTEGLLSEMCNFKNFNGKFITRRIKRFLLTIRKNEIDHFDDISVGGFHRREL